jgi:hypothetical protein
MNPTWSIYSGGRLTNQIEEHASFKITTDDALDGILLKSVSAKQAFENKLRRQLSRLVLPHSTLSPLSIAFQSAVVMESDKREVELSVVAIEDGSDSMLWHFLLRSPEENISPDNLDEIVVLIVNRLCPEKLNVKLKACL